MRIGEETIDTNSASSIASHCLAAEHNFSFIHGNADRTLNVDEEERGSNGDNISSDEKHALWGRRGRSVG